MATPARMSSAPGPRRRGQSAAAKVVKEPAPWLTGCTKYVAAWRAANVNDDDINVLALVKGRERYIFLFEDSQRADALRTLGRFASNSELSFSWYDAAVLSQKVRQAGPKSKSLDRITQAQPDDQ